MLDKTLKIPLYYREIEPVNLKENQPSIVTGNTDTEDEASMLWPPDAKRQLIGKTLMLGKLEGKRRRRQQRNEIVR